MCGLLVLVSGEVVAGRAPEPPCRSLDAAAIIPATYVGGEQQAAMCEVLGVQV